MSTVIFVLMVVTFVLLIALLVLHGLTAYEGLRAARIRRQAVEDLAEQAEDAMWHDIWRHRASR